MDFEPTSRKDEVLGIAEAEFGANVQFAYINHETKTATVLTLSEALEVCRHIVDASNEDILKTLREFRNNALKIAELKARRLAQAIPKDQA